MKTIIPNRHQNQFRTESYQYFQLNKKPTKLKFKRSQPHYSEDGVYIHENQQQKISNQQKKITEII